MSATAAALSQAEMAEPRRRSSVSVWNRFRRHKVAMIGTAFLALLVIASIGAPFLTEYDPNRGDLRARVEAPSSEHWRGTDATGRDVLTRLLYAGRVSLSVGLVAVAIYTLIGLVLGGIAGYYGGWLDSFIMRFADMVLSFPALLLIITIVSVLGPSIYNIMLVIGLLGWPGIARLVRGNFLTLREQDFVQAGRAIGASNSRIIFRHVLPNAVAPVIVAATFGIASAILLEAGLSFLGLGVQPPTASWGNMLTAAQTFQILETMPWLWLPPGAMIALAVLSINFVGDGLRDALDPRARR